MTKTDTNLVDKTRIFFLRRINTGVQKQKRRKRWTNLRQTFLLENVRRRRKTGGFKQIPP